MAEIVLDNLSVALSGRPILQGINLRVGAGACVALLGANGAGKSTLLRAAIGLSPPRTGSVRLNGADPFLMEASARARAAAYLPQIRGLAWPLLVRDVVALGRFAHGGNLGALHGPDAAAVERALAACDLQDLADRNADTLSGGERALMHIARALAAEAPVLFADEPVAALDPLHAWRVMELIRDFAQKGGAAVTVLHDPALAGRFCNRIVGLKDGRIQADGAPRDVLTPDFLAQIYGAAFEINWCGDAPALAMTGPARLGV
jgi:iron complex transport system ATP-binding protein